MGRGLQDGMYLTTSLRHRITSKRREAREVLWSDDAVEEEVRWVEDDARQETPHGEAHELVAAGFHVWRGRSGYLDLDLESGERMVDAGRGKRIFWERWSGSQCEERCEE